MKAHPHELSLLIVEDNSIVAADLIRQVRDFGYRVAAKLRTGERAVQYLRTHPAPDLVLMDIQLAGEMSGIEAARQITDLRPLPIIYLTANTDPATRRTARKTAPAAFLSKPFRSEDLEMAIELALDRFQRNGSANPSALEAPTTTGSTAFLLRDRIFVKEKRQLVRLLFEELLYATAEDYYCRLHTARESFLLTMTLKKLERALTARPEFVRVHRSHLVNLLHVTRVGEVQVYLGAMTLPMSRSGREAVVERLPQL